MLDQEVFPFTAESTTHNFVDTLASDCIWERKQWTC